jgi:hypothetical protein
MSHPYGTARSAKLREIERLNDRIERYQSNVKYFSSNYDSDALNLNRSMLLTDQQLLRNLTGKKYQS